MNYVFIIASASSFAIVYIFNNLLFRTFELSDYVSLVFVPSGIRIFCVLVFNFYGAIGILLGSLAVSLFYLNQTSPFVAITTALVAAGAAWFARSIAFKLLNLDENLANIKLNDLFQISIIFSVISAISHQLLFLELGISEDFTSGTLSMFAGDMTGALLCLFCARYLVRLTRRRY